MGDETFPVPVSDKLYKDLIYLSFGVSCVYVCVCVCKLDTHLAARHRVVLRGFWLFVYLLSLEEGTIGICLLTVKSQSVLSIRLHKSPDPSVILALCDNCLQSPSAGYNAQRIQTFMVSCVRLKDKTNTVWAEGLTEDVCVGDLI